MEISVISSGKHPAVGAQTIEHGVMVQDFEAGSIARNMPGHQRFRNVDIDQQSAFNAMNVIVPFRTSVVSTCLIGKRQFLYQSVLGQNVQGTIDRPIRNLWLSPPYSVENFACS